jgi:hypothetical protein
MRIPTKLILPLPEFLTAEYLRSVTLKELVECKEFMEYMNKCDELVTTSDDVESYVDQFSILVADGKFMPPTDRDFATALSAAKQVPITPATLERGVELCIRLTGPNDAIPNAFASYEFLTTVRKAVRHAAEQIGRRGAKVTDRFHRLCWALDRFTLVTFVIAVKVELGIEPPDSWQQPIKPDPGVDVGPAKTAAIAHAEDQPREWLTPAQIRQREGWSIWISTNLLGKANILLSWYWDAILCPMNPARSRCSGFLTLRAPSGRSLPRHRRDSGTGLTVKPPGITVKPPGCTVKPPGCTVKPPGINLRPVHFAAASLSGGSQRR